MFNIVYPFYNNHPAFNAIKDKLAELPCNITIVDDGSCIKLETSIPNIKIIRINEDRPWNQPAANNLGIRSLKKDSVVLRMDIDHFIDPLDFKIFYNMSKNIPKKTFYQFNRFDINLKKNIRENPNIMMFSYQDFLDSGGYDESFSGNYGYDDIEYILRLKHLGYKIEKSKNGIINVNSGFATKNLNRDTSINKSKLDKIIKKYR